MKRFTEVLSRTELHLFLFFLAFIVFDWPFLEILYRNRPRVFFGLFFLVWALAIVLLFFLGRSCGASGGKKIEEEERNV